MSARAREMHKILMAGMRDPKNSVLFLSLFVSYTYFFLEKKKNNEKLNCFFPNKKERSLKKDNRTRDRLGRV